MVLQHQLTFIGLDIGIGFGPSLLGLFTGFISYTEVYIIMAIVAALCTVLLLLLFMDEKLKHN